MKRQAASVPVMFAIVQAISRPFIARGIRRALKIVKDGKFLGGKRLGRFLAKSGIAGRSVI